jgi:hypothetical protein
MEKAVVPVGCFVGFQWKVVVINVKEQVECVCT